MKNTRVIIELTPSRLELAVVHARRVGATRVERVFPGESGENWNDFLTARRALLSRWVAELGVLGAPATVLYSSPTLACGVFACPRSAGQAGCDRAALLAAAEAASITPDVHPSDVLHLWSDEHAAVAPGTTASERQAHTLGAIDRETTTSALARWVEHAGLSVDRLVPADAPALIRCVRAVTAGHAPGITLWFGEHTSILAAGDKHRLRFVRPLNVGIESFVEALTRPIRSRNADAGLVTLDRVAARALLLRGGIPAPEEMYDQERDIPGSAVLPLLQPVLQRFAVEVKQSLRFGLNDEERASAGLDLCGPGCALHRLGQVIAQSAGVRAGTHSTGDAGASPVIDAALEFGPHEFSLLPAALERQRTSTRVRRGMWIGLGASAALIACHAGFASLALLSENKALSTLSARAGEADQRLAAEQTAREALARTTGLTHRAAQTLGETGAWSALLTSIARLTPQAMRLTNIELQSTETGPECRIAGLARVGGDARFAELVNAYNRELAALPLVRTVKLGSTARQNSPGQPDAFRFDLTLSLIPLPALASTPGEPGYAAGGAP